MCIIFYVEGNFIRLATFGKGMRPGLRLRTTSIVGLTCGRPSQIQNGRRQGSSARFLSSVKYQCNKPYELIGSSVRTCRGIKEWDGEPPQCSKYQMFGLSTELIT